jgi:hypothetical protein
VVIVVVGDEDDDEDDGEEHRDETGMATGAAQPLFGNSLIVPATPSC